MEAEKIIEAQIIMEKEKFKDLNESKPLASFNKVRIDSKNNRDIKRFFNFFYKIVYEVI